jgi:hypothetical protein
LEQSLSTNSVNRIIHAEWCYGEISLKDLRQFESTWQKENGHKHDASYYNRSDSMHPVCDNEISKQKISNTLKAQGANPYCENTHSPKALTKAKETKAKHKWKWFYNLQTGESKNFPTGITEVPSGWERGKKPKTPSIKKEGGMKWVVYKNGEVFWSGQNLKKWCTSNNLSGLAYNTNSFKVKEIESKLMLSLSEKRSVIVNDIDTGLKQCEFAEVNGLSRSHLSTRINTHGYMYKYSVAIYSANKIR